MSGDAAALDALDPSTALDAKAKPKTKPKPKVFRVTAVPATRCVSVQQVAEWLDVSEWTVREYIHSGKLVAVKLPPTRGPEATNRRVLVAVSDFDAFVAQHRGVTP